MWGRHPWHAVCGGKADPNPSVAMSSHFALIAVLGATAALAGCLALASRTWGKTVAEPGKTEPFESGKLRTAPAWGRYHVRYYALALLFLAFDMEMAYMYPWAVVYRELGMMALLDMGVFLLILFLGLLYCASQGGLKRQ